MNRPEEPLRSRTAKRRLCFVCRECTRMWQAWERDETECGQPCGGPGNGMDFPRYSGELTAESFLQRCIVCGDPSVGVFQVVATGRMYGVCCEAHARVLMPDGSRMDVVKMGGEIVPVTAPPPRPSSLYDVLGIDPVKDLGFPPEKPDEDDGKKSLEKP